MEILEQVQKYGYVREAIAPEIDLIAEINRLRKEKNAVILAHYYVDGAIQDLADYIGDSLGLSQQAASTPADMIVFCGVHFMGETAKILSPEKKVVIPDLNAGCSLADSALPISLRPSKPNILTTWCFRTSTVRPKLRHCRTSS